MKERYNSLSGQTIVSQGTIFGEQGRNFEAIRAYEQTMLAVAEHPDEVLKAYEQEDDPRVYVVAINGKVVAVNNRRSITRYLNGLAAAEETVVMVHCLGMELNPGLRDDLMVYSQVS